MNDPLTERLRARNGGLCLYGLAPPKSASPSGRLQEIAAQQSARLEPLSIDGLIVYDIQDEAARASEPRPFPFLPTLDPDTYAYEHLASLGVQKVVYCCVTRDTPKSFIAWLGQQDAATSPRASVLVGAREAIICDVNGQPGGASEEERVLDPPRQNGVFAKSTIVICARAGNRAPGFFIACPYFA